MRRCLDFSWCLVINAMGSKGGLALLWRLEDQCQVVSFSQNHIYVIVNDLDTNAQWLLTSFYGELETSKRQKT